jgi:hypothetical protein
MSLIFATQLTAVATLALAVLALATAVLALLAWRKQSKEVRDQAKMLEVQSERLDEQRKINAEQTRVLELQARELRASLDARERQSLELRTTYALTVVAWQDEPQSSGHGWLVVAHVLNTGERPVRDMSAPWYVDGSPLRDRAELTACLMPRDRKNFDCRVDGAAIRAGLKAIVQFRTVGEDWWSAGTDGGLVGGMSNDRWRPPLSGTSSALAVLPGPGGIYQT